MWGGCWYGFKERKGVTVKGMKVTRMSKSSSYEGGEEVRMYKHAGEDGLSACLPLPNLDEWVLRNWTVKSLNFKKPMNGLATLS